LDEDNIKSASTEEELTQLREKTDEVLRWLEDNYEAPKEEVEAQKKALEDLYTPIITRAYQKSSQGAAHGDGSSFAENTSSADAAEEQPHIDEVD